MGLRRLADHERQGLANGDLPFSARQVLERLGVRDLVLPEPEGAPSPPRPLATGEPDLGPEEEAGIGALVRRIEAFQRARRGRTNAPRLPLGDAREPEAERPGAAFDFATDARGTIVWADPAMAPLAVGMVLGPPRTGAVAVLDPATAQALEPEWALPTRYLARYQRRNR